MTRTISLPVAFSIPATALLVALTSLACGPRSSLGDDEPVEVTGALLGADGPIASHRVLLSPRLSLFDAAEFVESGLEDHEWRCHQDDPPAICNGIHRTQSDAKGEYRFDLKGEDAKDSAGFALEFVASSHWPSDDPEAVEGGGTRATFHINDPSIVVPTLQPWTPDMNGSIDGSGRVTLVHSKLSDDLGYGGARHRAGVVSEYGTIASSESNGTTTYPPEVLADYQVDWLVSASRDITNHGIEFDLVYVSHRLPLGKGTLVPASRGAACRVTRAGNITYESIEECIYTDGDPSHSPSGPFDDRHCPQAPPCETGGEAECEPAPPCPTVVEIELAELITFDTIVIRYREQVGADDPAGRPWETSVDGEVWTPLALSEPSHSPSTLPFRLLQTTRPTQARFIRVSDADFLDGAGEIDLFE